MNTFLRFFKQSPRPPADTLHQVAFLIISLCVLAIFSAVFVNFMASRRHQDVKNEKRSLVATGTMTLFFFFVYTLIHRRIGTVPIGQAPLQFGMAVIGLSIIVFGCAVNILGRLHLGKNWANQATIYRDQKLVVSGVYALVRHPLYASLIWMFYGACLVYANVAAFMATSLVFVPFMLHRARLEENLLAKEFADYPAYRQRVSMLVPKLFKGEPI
jgi:protein-S-isoprenylcysteine O-methyltransferase Ste14